MKIVTNKNFHDEPFKKLVWNLSLTKNMSGCGNVNGYLYMHMHNFIAEIEELQANLKGVHQQKGGIFTCKTSELFSKCFSTCQEQLFISKKD